MNFPHRTIRIKSHDLSEPAFGSDHPPYPIVTNTTSDCRQQNIKRWTVFHPFHANIPQQQSDSTIPNQLSHAREIFLDHLTPYGSPIMGIDPIKILRVFVLNTQHSLQIYRDNLKMLPLISSIIYTGAQMFMPISPNVNWTNPSNVIQTKHIFRELHTRTHLSTISSSIELDREYINSSLVGGAAIITSGIWATQITETVHDKSGYGIFTSTTI